MSGSPRHHVPRRRRPLPRPRRHPATEEAEKPFVEPIHIEPDENWFENLTEMVERWEEEKRWEDERKRLRRARAASDEKRRPPTS